MTDWVKVTLIFVCEPRPACAVRLDGRAIVRGWRTVCQVAAHWE